MPRALVSATSRRDFVSKDSQDVKHLMVSPPELLGEILVFDKR
ncbi:MAG: hypothetical protein OJF50_001990 [Nitrospira sp.]|nr:hypothetical protein [Nitrospira sp.]